jgi:hypothetical protein
MSVKNDCDKFMKILSKNSNEKVTDFAAKFAAAKPFKYLIVDDFLEKAFAERLIDEFPEVADPPLRLC